MRIPSTFTGALSASLLAATALAAAAPTGAGPDAQGRAGEWAQWRGPNRDGISTETGWSYRWPANGPRKLWSRSIGSGYAAVAVSGGRVFAMGNRKNVDTVWCLDAATGQVIWKHAYACKAGTWKGPRVAPLVDGERVYTFSRDGRLLCLAVATGRVIWFRDLRKALALRIPRHGLACHPLLVDNMLILEVGARDGSVVALDKLTGRVIWQAGREACGYSSPVLCTIGRQRCVIVFTGSAVVAHRLSDGKPMWRVPWKTPYECSIATPIVAGDKVFVSAAYDMGCALLEVSPGGAKTVWRNKRMSNHLSGCVLWKGHLYGFDGSEKKNSKAFLKCMDLATGKVLWSVGGMGKGSLMVADGKLIILSESGELCIAEASPQGYRPLARARVLSGTCWTMPVLAGGRIYCRSYEGTLVCVDVSGRRPAASSNEQPARSRADIKPKGTEQ